MQLADTEKQLSENNVELASLLDEKRKIIKSSEKLQEKREKSFAGWRPARRSWIKK